MNRLIFEGRFLVNLSGAIIRQGDLRPARGQVDWERMYRVADYHKIANIVYLALLGSGKKIPERWQEAFTERYHQSLQYGDDCSESEKEILTLLDMKKVPCLVLESCEIRNLYQMPETAANGPLKILLDEESYMLAKGYLVDLGYETETFYTGYGERMKQMSGFCVELYRKLPFQARSYEKGMQILLRRAGIKSPYNGIRTLSFEDRFIFYMAKCAYHYAQDGLLIREVMDLYLYHRAWQERINREHVQKTLSKFRVEALAQKILWLSYMWFGSLDELDEENRPQELEDFDVLENRILSRAMLGQETDQQALMLKEMIRKQEEKERRQERFAKWKKQRSEKWGEFSRRMRWIFPEFRYMCTVYPLLEKLPFLLPFYWLCRLLRFMIRGSQE